MFLDLRSAAALRFDLCVVGAGVAGIIVALELFRRSPATSILLLECGNGRDGRNPLDDSIEIRNPANHHLPYDCTNKGLGGSSITWGGRCVMYDEVDFVPHGPVKDGCTWSPAFLKSVEPFLARTAEYFQCGRPEFDLPAISRDAPPLAEHFQSGTITDTKLERWSLPTRFGKEYRRQLATSNSIRVLSGCRAVSLAAPMSGDVRELTVKSLEGGELAQIRASAFVLAAGGQESTRLLLKSPEVFRELPSPPDSLGRFYQGHVSGKIANIRFKGNPDKTDYGFIRDGGVYCRRRLQFTKDELIRQGLLNTAFWLDNPPYQDPAHGNGILSFVYLAVTAPLLRKRLLPPALARSVTAGTAGGRGPHMMNVIKGLPASLLVPIAIFVRRYLCRRSLPGVFLKSRENRYALHFHSEQTPCSENKMTLSPNGERLLIDYAYSAEDVDSVIRAHQRLDEVLRGANCGELEYLFPNDTLPEAIRHISMDGLHQVGTTRIADGPAEGVVDSDLRVFGTRNLYVCSSSVFPTSSQANPTFFLGACAVRLADHISGRQAGG